MTCKECHCEAKGRAEAWKAYLVDMDEDGKDDGIF